MATLRLNHRSLAEMMDETLRRRAENGEDANWRTDLMVEAEHGDELEPPQTSPSSESNYNIFTR